MGCSGHGILQWIYVIVQLVDIYHSSAVDSAA